MILPHKLKYGDTIAIISLSSGIAGDESIIWRTYQGIERLKSIFNLNVKIMPNALAGSDYLYNHPEKRADDLHKALLDPEVKAIINCIGGSESIRIIPFLDPNIIKNNPKIFLGYSDITSLHMYFYKLGITTYYGPALLTDFAENVAMDQYTIDYIYKTLFTTDASHNIKNATYIRDSNVRWEKENQIIQRGYIDKGEYELINGRGVVSGKLIGGCLETLNNLRGTDLFPSSSTFKNAILFIENSGSFNNTLIIEQNIRTLGYLGILKNVNGIIIGTPANGADKEEIKNIWKKMMKEWQIEDTPVLYNASFGHNEPKFILPYGVKAEINAEQLSFTIKENTVSN
ncbi:S66 family peptidase [Mammaliicoccus sciuri]|uniref:S66 family peptidase n=1 Tax=Mammaliicoccus sciuri TaxID=1296 RepID=UPI000D1E6B27|nr:S66 peptidase family protein [Mammaliicoccus sciuri]MCJ0968745.1 LD-carboxypeptidase [Mammaliicoccus sciuri]MEB6339531.1 LD-carboxypeptidase [Mammaliicoccus sciuri]PTJ50318.1 LD-carboxypeptidase [Mammaliicoccus sciuri]